MKIENIAKICHETNRAFCFEIGDPTQPAWEQAPDWQRNSAINGVKFHLENPEATSAASHECWLSQKQSEGWVLGPVKNPKTKEHPCMVPFAMLPPEQQAKDALFKGVVDALRNLVTA